MPRNKKIPRYIDADALYQTIDDWRKELALTYGDYDDYVEALGDVLDIIDDAPTEDVVEKMGRKDESADDKR